MQDIPSPLDFVTASRKPSAAKSPNVESPRGVEIPKRETPDNTRETDDVTVEKNKRTWGVENKG